MTHRRARTIERLRLIQWNIDNGIDEVEEIAIRRFVVEIVGLIANGVTLAALHSMIVVVEHFLEWPAINRGLVALKTFALLSFERLDRDRTKFDPLDGAPRLR